MAAKLSEDPRLAVERVRGGLGELSVLVDGVQAYRSNPFWYPRSETVLGAVREWLAGVLSQESCAIPRAPERPAGKE